MRRLRIVIGIATAATALASAGPALASKEVEKHFFGEFTAFKAGQVISPASPLVAKGLGEIEEFRIAGVKIECSALTGTAEAFAERSTSLKITLGFKKCTHEDHQGNAISHPHVTFKRPLVLNFHANGSARVVTIEENEAEVKIKPAHCKYHIPEQEIPLGAENKPNNEFEDAEYSTETESIETKGGLKKFPSGVRERLEVDMVFKAIKTTFKPEGPQCEYVKGEEAKFNPEKGIVETDSRFEAEIEEITAKGGSIGFDTTPEA
jgi:hypothetical protein